MYTYFSTTNVEQHEIIQICQHGPGRSLVGHKFYFSVQVSLTRNYSKHEHSHALHKYNII